MLVTASEALFARVSIALSGNAMEVKVVAGGGELSETKDGGKVDRDGQD